MAMDEFETFLAGETEKYDNELTDELLASQLQVEFDTLLDECDVPTPFRFNAEQRDTRMLLADSDARDNAYTDGKELQRALMLVLGVYKFRDQVDAVDMKKAIMANAFVYAGYESDSAWVQFADKLLPGTEGLDFNAPRDAIYIESARQAQKDRQRKMRVFEEVVLGCVERLIEADESPIVATEDYTRALQLCRRLYERDDAQKAATVDETVRVTGLSRQSIVAICRAYDRFYDQIGGYSSIGLL